MANKRPACDPEDPCGDMLGKVTGFSLHANVAAKAYERNKPERLCGNINCPAVAETRLSFTPVAIFVTS